MPKSAVHFFLSTLPGEDPVAVGGTILAYAHANTSDSGADP